MSLPTMLLLLQTIAPDTVLTFWSLACSVAMIVGLAVGYWLQRPTDPFAHHATHAVGHVDQVEQDDTTSTGPRHAGIGIRAWTPQHTADAAARRGRHHTGERRLVASLLDTRTDITVAELQQAMAGAR